MDEEKEIWRNIKGYEGRYQVSNFGRIRSLSKTIINCRGRMQLLKDKILKPENVFDGYERVCLCNNGKRQRFRVARLVYETFVEPIPEGLEIDHINGVRTDNHLINLRAVSHKANCWNPITRERHLAANERRSRYKKEWWAKKKVTSK